jgi:hypothetical protein
MLGIRQKEDLAPGRSELNKLLKTCHLFDWQRTIAPKYSSQSSETFGGRRGSTIRLKIRLGSYSMDFAANTALPNCAVARDRRKPLLQLVEGVPRGRQAAAWMFAAMRRASSRVSRLAAALFRLPPVQIGVACFSKMTLANTGPQSRDKAA